MAAPQPGDDKYIRTFAKDVALMQGKPVPDTGDTSASETETPKPAEPAPQAAPQTDDREAVLARLKARSVQTPLSRSTMLPTELPTPIPTPVVPDTNEIPAVPPPPPPVTPWQPGDLPTYQPETPIAAVPAVETPLPPPPATEVAPPTPSAPVPTPSFTEQMSKYREPVPENVELSNAELRPQMRQSSIPTTAPQYVPDRTTASPIHTYTTDFADKIDASKASTFSVLAAEQDAAPVSQVSAPKKKNLALIAGGIVLVLMAGGLTYAAYRYMGIRTAVPFVQRVPSLIFADEEVEVNGEGNTLILGLVNAIAAPLGPNQVRIFYTTTASTTSTGTTKQITPGGRLIGALQLAAPDILMRNIGSDSTIGAVNDGNDQRLFMILRTLSYERTFAGMLQWEPEMALDLQTFYPEYPAPPAPPPTIATTTKMVKGKLVVSTTTVESVAPSLPPPQFVDEISANHNVRALKDGAGRTILLYGYMDKETLIIARDEAAFTEIVTRLSATTRQ